MRLASRFAHRKIPPAPVTVITPVLTRTVPHLLLPYAILLLSLRASVLAAFRRARADDDLQLSCE